VAGSHEIHQGIGSYFETANAQIPCMNATSSLDHQKTVMRKPQPTVFQRVKHQNRQISPIPHIKQDTPLNFYKDVGGTWY